MRVALRRLRAVLSSFAPFLSAETRAQVSSKLRWLANTLGEARNLDVFALELLAPTRATLPASSEMARLSIAIERQRDLAHETVRQALASRDYKASVREATRWFNERCWRTEPDADQLDLPIDQLAPRMLEPHFRRAKKLSVGFTLQSEDERHSLRIALKKLRYSVELLGTLYDEKCVRRFISQLKHLQNDLGKINDLRVARELIFDLVGPGTRKTGIALAGHQVLDWHLQCLDATASALQPSLAQLFRMGRFWPAPGA